jgi:hypothetical protein
VRGVSEPVPPGGEEDAVHSMGYGSGCKEVSTKALFLHNVAVVGLGRN